MWLLELTVQNIGTILVFLITFFMVLDCLQRRSRSQFNLPPGPATVPFFGNSLSIKKDDAFLDQMNGWAKEFGPVFSLYYGRKLVVVVNGMDAYKELTCKRQMDLAGRPEVPAMNNINPQRKGITEAAPDEEWKVQRKLAHAYLLEIGMTSLGPAIQQEAKHLVEHFKAVQGSPMDPCEVFGTVMSNIISGVLFSRPRDEYGSKVVNQLVKSARKLSVTDSGILLNLFPFLWPILKNFGDWKRHGEAWENIKALIHKEAQNRMERMAATEGEPEVKDFLDAYLVAHTNEPETYSLDTLDHTLMDIYNASTDCKKSTMNWAVAYLAMYPEIQQKIHDEIVKEVGDKEITLEHRTGLNYTQAAILEIMRLSSVSATNGRAASKDAVLGGYDIPKGTEIILNTWSIHHDPDVWENPNELIPERFLNEDGTVTKYPKNYMNFSAGKRMCPGDGYTKKVVFIVFTSLVQHIKFSLPPGQDTIDLVGLFDQDRRPKPFKVVASTWSN